MLLYVKRIKLILSLFNTLGFGLEEALLEAEIQR